MDANFANVVLLLKGTGPDGSVFIEDSSGANNKGLIRPLGNASISTVRSKFYDSSIYLDGTGDYLTYNEVCTLLVNTPYTIEGWFYRPSNITGYDSLFGFHNSTDGANIEVFCADGITNVIGSTFSTADITNCPTGEWFHYAVCREQTSVRVYLNGTLLINITSTGWGVTSESLFSIGQEYDSGPKTSDFLNANINDFRITAGIARYSANFTPPGSFFGTIEGTIYDKNGDPCQRKIGVIPHGKPGCIFYGESDPSTGEYSIVVPKCEVTRVVMSEDDDPLLNDLVDRVLVY